MRDNQNGGFAENPVTGMANNSLNQLKCGKKGAFGRNTDTHNKKERLDELLEKIEDYTRFILQQNIRTHKHQQRQKLAEGILNGNGENGVINGGKNVSKRR